MHERKARRVDKNQFFCCRAGPFKGRNNISLMDGLAGDPTDRRAQYLCSFVAACPRSLTDALMRHKCACRPVGRPSEQLSCRREEQMSERGRRMRELRSLNPTDRPADQQRPVLYDPGPAVLMIIARSPLQGDLFMRLPANGASFAN